MIEQILHFAGSVLHVGAYVLYVLWLFGSLLREKFRPPWLSFLVTANDGFKDTRGVVLAVTCFVMSDALHYFATRG